jgi:hypothetical protein
MRTDFIGYEMPAQMHFEIVILNSSETLHQVIRIRINEIIAMIHAVYVVALI